ncbi:ubiquitin carboxyl-terminal hydrolase 34 [Podospora australis]|uniref:Ubiquitin carboxyl-terminal hydrolase 34 n=1 Tax=Podospora australis TaxID=1536484 RepID=A0AAN7AL43_9PEZI|nr:ubiquitin carboxyl-terminal hydrolase 34 [Podospora australis]
MAQASTTAEEDSRDRAVSSEPCSTRPNPFDDSDVSARKRRRTSLNSGSRSRSIDSETETLTSSPRSSTLGERSSPEIRTNGSDMKIDSDPTVPTTPEQHPLDKEPRSEQRSSRVTINVRTPSRPPPLQVIPSSPSSPSLESSTPAAASPRNDTKVSMEESEVEMAQGDTVVDTPVSSASGGSSSPPVEIVAVQPDDSDTFDECEAITILDDEDQDIGVDPSRAFPFVDHTEPWHEAISRLALYLPTHNQVPRQVSDWMKAYLSFAQSTSHRTFMESYMSHRELWANLPSLMSKFVCREAQYPREKELRQDIFTFYKWFARLTAFFVKKDWNELQRDQNCRPQDLISPAYINNLIVITRREEVVYHSSPQANGDEDWSYDAEVQDILNVFQDYNNEIVGGSLTVITCLARLESERVSQFPAFTEHIGQLSMVACTVLQGSYRRAHRSSHPTPVVETAKANIKRGYQFFLDLSASLSHVVDKTPNHFSIEATANLLASLTEIYRMALDMDGVVPAETMEDHRQKYPTIIDYRRPEAIALIWKFGICAKLIQSSQMQLRISAVSTLSHDLVTLFRKYGEQPEDRDMEVMRYFADFLLRTGLIRYILGPSCHPEVTIESFNIIGFLSVSKTYTHQHTDILWDTVMTTQDPRISDALLKMIGRILHLFSLDAGVYLCRKLGTVPVESFGPGMRECLDQVIKLIMSKSPDRIIADPAPYDLCIRLIRESSGFGYQSPVAHSELQQFAIKVFKELLIYGPSAEGRRNIFLDCVCDIAKPSPSSIGSLWVLYTVMRIPSSRDLNTMALEHNLLRLLIGEFEAAIPRARAAGFPAVLSGLHNLPRKELLQTLILLDTSFSTEEGLGLKLWQLLVGRAASCKEDRDAAWQVLNYTLGTTLKRNHGINSFNQGPNSFLAKCYSEYLPSLEPEFYCPGALDFVVQRVMPEVNEPSSIVLDDDEGVDNVGIEVLWRMVLTAPKNSIEQKAIHALVNDVYVSSGSILSFPHYRARKVHLALVNRCLRQLSMAAAQLKKFSDGQASGDEDSMVLVATDHEVQEQELLFVRSLAVLKEFHRLHRARPEFAVPDLRSLIKEPPKDIEGESAELKYQSFDGESRTPVKPLSIGKLNTAGSLLGSLRDATGFSNYRIYYRGRPFVPQENEICKSLADLQIHNGIILVKKDSETPVVSPRVRPGASSVETEILGHFEELWEYLSLDQNLAQEIYVFLVKLPADESIFKAIQDSHLSYRDLFPLGQPFKSLYTLHALREYIASKRPKVASAVIKAKDHTEDNNQSAVSLYADALMRAVSLVVPAICSEEVGAQCSGLGLQMDLGTNLVELLVGLLKDQHLPESVAQFLDEPLLNRLLAMVSTGLATDPHGSSTRHISLCLQAILESCSLSDPFMMAFCRHPGVSRLLEQLLLHEPRAAVRSNTVSLIQRKCGLANFSDSRARSEHMPAAFRELFWPVVSGLVEPAIAKPDQATEVLHLCRDLFQTLCRNQVEILDPNVISVSWLDLFLQYTTFEDVTKPSVVDNVAFQLVHLLHIMFCSSDLKNTHPEIFPAEGEGVAQKIFWKHLYPATLDTALEFESGRPINSSKTRILLMELVIALANPYPTEFKALIEDLFSLVEITPGPECEYYQYELPQQFEREKAIRSPCGYQGLRNLSNTCYFNSLFTQLFMNVDFRQFMLSVDVRDKQGSQGLLFNTQKLFAYMQDSLARFYQPDECVASIKTYEDSQIDIGIQMDVDEFYNLLFDRWESQFLTNDEKNRFRSFYGGQLVQQVRSKECNHISERLEPFSAIQCDIKGKNSLQESLQAYVDGEIMEGDNKYKCSTCDRHVDAVKRACLKDIPDNLIFHLKRFDFNLRMMQRNKINDYFSFPEKIDMRPYTIDHLSDSSPDQAEDVFELVGVLVHSGTAESGHYYSFVRERPSSNDGNQTWVEFNDDNVINWDPQQLEGACFGGMEYQSHFQSNGMSYEKQYSAYMLFYQRSSSLARSQEALRHQNVPTPLRVTVPREMEEYIQEQNTYLVRRHCLYDQSQIKLVSAILERVRQMHSGDSQPDAHTTVTLAIFMALGHLDQVASRAKDAPQFKSLAHQIRSMCQTCIQCSIAVAGYFDSAPDAAKMLVQKNADPEVRQISADLILDAADIIKRMAPQSYGDPSKARYDLSSRAVSGAFMKIIDVFWSTFHTSIRSWQEVFAFMFNFLKLGRQEVRAFMKAGFLEKAIWLVLADPSFEHSMPANYIRLLNALNRRGPARPPSYDSFLDMLDYVLAHVKIGERVDPDELEELEELPDSDTDLLFLQWRNIQASVFVDKLISINQNEPATHSIITNLIKQSSQMEESTFVTLRQAIMGAIPSHGLPLAPYLRVASAVFCRHATDIALILELIAYVTDQCKCLQNSEGKAFLEFQKVVFDGPREMSGESEDDIICRGLRNMANWLPSLIGYYDASVGEDVEAFFHEKIIKPHNQLMEPDDESQKRRYEALVEAGRRIGINSLVYLRDNHIAPNTDVSERVVTILQRVIKACGRFFTSKNPEADPLGHEFWQLNHTVMEQVARLTVVDDVEEDGSGMYDYSDSSSIASSNTAG